MNLLNEEDLQGAEFKNCVWQDLQRVAPTPYQKQYVIVPVWEQKCTKIC
jgi:hypothetical protein